MTQMIAQTVTNPPPAPGSSVLQGPLIPLLLVAVVLVLAAFAIRRALTAAVCGRCGAKVGGRFCARCGRARAGSG